MLIWNRNSRHDLEFKTNPRIYTVPKCLYLGKRTNITYTGPFTLVRQLKSFHMSLYWEEVSVFTVVTDVFQGVNQAQTQFCRTELSYILCWFIEPMDQVSAFLITPDLESSVSEAGPSRYYFSRIFTKEHMDWQVKLTSWRISSPLLIHTALIHMFPPPPTTHNTT